MVVQPNKQLSYLVFLDSTLLKNIGQWRRFKKKAVGLSREQSKEANLLLPITMLVFDSGDFGFKVSSAHAN